MKPYDVRWRLGTTFCLLAAVLVVIGWQGIHHLRKLDRELQAAIYDRCAEEHQVYEAFRLSDLNARILLSVFLIDDQSEVKRLLDERGKNSDQISGLIRGLEPRLETEEERRLLAEVEVARVSYVASYKQALAKLMEARRPDEARAIMVKVSLPRIAAYHTAFAAFNQFEVVQIQQAIQRARADFLAAERELLFQLIVAGIITIGGAAAVTTRLTREMGRRRRAEETLRLSHDHLEERIHERTAQLARITVSFQSEMAARRKSENELRRVSTAVEQSPVAIIITDLTGAMVYANPKLCSVSGYALDEVLGQNPRLFKSGETSDDDYRKLWAAICSGEEWRGEFHNRKKNGEFYWVSASISPIRDDSGAVTHFVGIQEDITERKAETAALERARRDLMESERRHKLTLNNLPDAIWLKDEDGHYLAVNQAWCQFFGLDESQVLGKTDAELLPPDLARKFRENDILVKSSGKPLQVESRIVKSYESPLWFDVSLAPLTNAEGRFCGATGIARNTTRRRNAEAAVLESRRFLQSSLDALSAHIAILDENGVIVEVNAPWKKFARENSFLGSRHGIGLNYLNLCESATGDCAADAFAVAKGIRGVIAGECPEFILEYPCHSPRERRWFQVRVTRFAGNAPVRVVVAHENITNRKLIQEELQRKTSFLEAQVYSTIDGILVVDEQGHKVLQNQRLAELLHIPKELADDPDDERQRQWVTQSTKNPDEFLKKIKQLYSNRQEVSRDEIELKDGTVLDRYSAPMHGKDGSYYGRMWVFRDLTDRKKMEESLLRSERKFHYLADNISDVFWITSPDLGAIHYISRGYELIWGRSMASLYANAHQWVEAILPEDRARVWEIFGPLTKDKPEVSAEYRIVRPDGTVRWIHDRGFQVHDTDGNLIRLTGIASDITARKEVAEQLLAAKEAADSANRAKSEFLAIMSHEIRTPMNGLLGFTDLLLETPLTLEQQQFVNTIHGSGQALLKLINDILDFSKIEAGRLTLENLRFSLPEILNETVGLLAGQAKQKGLAFAAKCDPALPDFLVGDPTRVRQVLLNLIGNAIKFTSAGGVTVSARFDPANPALACISITDTGIGIPLETQGELFQLFTQADTSTTRRHGGTGLGLAISKRLVERMGGTIGLISEPGKGSEFWFTLPLHKVNDMAQMEALPAPNSQTASESASGCQTKFRVLLAEDDAVNRKLVIQMLKKYPCEIETAVDGKAAVELASKGNHDVILMDCRMPEMDGLEATREIRRMENGASRAPIIAVTANVGEGQREKCFAAGMDDFIEKPLRPGALDQALQKWVFRAASHADGKS